MRKLTLAAIAFAFGTTALSSTAAATEEPIYETARQVCEAIAAQPQYEELKLVVYPEVEDRAGCSFFDRAGKERATFGVFITPAFTKKQADEWKKTHAQLLQNGVVETMGDDRLLYLLAEKKKYTQKVSEGLGFTK